MSSPAEGLHDHLEGIVSDCRKMLHLLPGAIARRGIEENASESLALRARLESVIQRCLEERARLEMGEEAEAQTGRTLQEIDEELSCISEAARVLSTA